MKLRKRGTGSNLVDMGRGAVHDHHRWVVNSVTGLACRWGGHGEGLRRSHDDAAGAKLDAKLIDRFSVNTGTIPCRSRYPGASRAFGIDPSSVEGAGWCPAAFLVSMWGLSGAVDGEDGLEGNPAGLSFFVCDATVIKFG